ncbi:MAG: hypothetical protein ABI843_07580 [Dokdonella sp.]
MTDGVANASVQSHDPATCPNCAQRRARIESIAADTGFPVGTVAWVAGAVHFIGTWQRKGASKRHVDAAELCRMLIADFGERDPVRLRSTLESIGVRSSRDIGRIVYALVEAGLCEEAENDSEQDFADLFELDDLAGYLDRSGLRMARDWPVAIKRAIVLAVYLCGAALTIVGSQSAARAHWVWIGCALFTVGWAISALRYPRPQRFGIAWSTLQLRAPR